MIYESGCHLGPCDEDRLNKISFSRPKESPNEILV